MATKVKFLMTSAGAYGRAQEGDEIVVSNSVANHLEKNGVVKVLGETEEEIHKPEHGGVVFTDNTGKQDAPAGATDTKNPTGQKAGDQKAPAKAKKSSKK